MVHEFKQNYDSYEGVVSNIEKHYDSNGELSKVVKHFHNSIRREEFDAEGNLMSICGYDLAYGKKHGYHILFHENGNVFRKYRYYYGTLDGSYEEYFPSGNLYISCVIVNGRLEKGGKEFNEIGNELTEFGMSTVFPPQSNGGCIIL